MLSSSTSLVGCFDVYYYEDYANACCVVFQAGPTETVVSEYRKLVSPVEDYKSGEFYRRELLCLLGVYTEIKEILNLLIVDGFVFLQDGKRGLGAHLYEALGGKIPVTGVAKTHFRNVTQCAEVTRGKSHKPLYVSSIGVDLSYSAEFVKSLKGNHRIPDVLRRVDRLSRELRSV